MNETKLNYYRNLFLNILKEDSKKEEDLLLLENEKGDEMDKAIEDRDNRLILKLQGRHNFYIKKVMDALMRIDEGTFGYCHDCGEEIEENRLHARPTARFCITCKEEQERAEGHILYHKKSHTLGKTFTNDNVVNIPLKGEEISKENVLNFKKNKAGMEVNDLLHF